MLALLGLVHDAHGMLARISQHLGDLGTLVEFLQELTRSDNVLLGLIQRFTLLILFEQQLKLNVALSLLHRQVTSRSFRQDIFHHFTDFACDEW